MNVSQAGPQNTSKLPEPAVYAEGGEERREILLARRVQRVVSVDAAHGREAHLRGACALSAAKLDAMATRQSVVSLLRREACSPCPVLSARSKTWCRHLVGHSGK